MNQAQRSKTLRPLLRSTGWDPAHASKEARTWEKGTEGSCINSTHCWAGLRVVARKNRARVIGRSIGRWKDTFAKIPHERALVCNTRNVRASR
jgi:hypothetical protein